MYIYTFYSLCVFSSYSILRVYFPSAIAQEIPRWSDTKVKQIKENNNMNDKKVTQSHNIYIYIWARPNNSQWIALYWRRFADLRYVPVRSLVLRSVRCTFFKRYVPVRSFVLRSVWRSETNLYEFTFNCLDVPICILYVYINKIIKMHK